MNIFQKGMIYCMPLYVNNAIPYMHTSNKKVALPRDGIKVPVGSIPDPSSQLKMGYGNLVFLLAPTTADCIKMVNNKTNCFHDTSSN